MYFLMRCLHHPDMAARRDEKRSLHREWVRSGGNGLAIVLIGSALLDADGVVMGNFGILSATGADQAQAFAKGDPFNMAGIVRTIELNALPDTFQAHRISDPMSVVGGA